MKARAIVFHQHGEPSEVAHCGEFELAEAGAGQVGVRVLFAPINPADLNVLQGSYAKLPHLPAVPGGEGVGEVYELGSGVAGVTVGERVLLSAGLGSWRERLIADSEALIRVPEDVDLQQAAMLRVNPPTAFRMLHDFVPLQRGDWVLQNASNSGVGRAVIQICAAKGWRTLNLVRRQELAEELKAIGADAVVVEGDNVAHQIAEITGGESVRLALNAVGGESALRLANGLSPEGTLVTYGVMSRQPLRIPGGLLIFKDLRLRGFWVTQWYLHASHEAIDGMFAEIYALAREGRLHTPVDSIFALEDAAAALKRAGEGGRAGKVLFKP